MALRSTFFAGVMASIGVASLLVATDGLAQTRAVAEAECRVVRERLAGHARLSEGVRRDLTRWTPGLRATQPRLGAGAATPAGGRAEAIRSRLERIPEERQRLEDARLASYLRFEFGRATELGRQVQALDSEKTN